MGFTVRRGAFNSWFSSSPARLAARSGWDRHRGSDRATAQSATFVRKVLAPMLPESPFELRFFLVGEDQLPRRHHHRSRRRSGQEPGRRRGRRRPRRDGALYEDHVRGRLPQRAAQTPAPASTPTARRSTAVASLRSSSNRSAAGLNALALTADGKKLLRHPARPRRVSGLANRSSGYGAPSESLRWINLSPPGRPWHTPRQHRRGPGQPPDDLLQALRGGPEPATPTSPASSTSPPTR